MDLKEQLNRINNNAAANDSVQFVQKTVKVKSPDYYKKIEIELNKKFLLKLKAKCSRENKFLGDFLNAALLHKYEDLKAGGKMQVVPDYGKVNTRTSVDIPKELHGKIKELCTSTGLLMKNFKTDAVIDHFEREYK